MRYEFIKDHRNDYPVTLLCRVMQVARSGYYAWRNEPLSLRKVANLVLLQHMRRDDKPTGVPEYRASWLTRAFSVDENGWLG